MRELTPEQETIAAHYCDHFQFEADRLEKLCPVEFSITCRWLERWVAPDSVVADVGVGVGHYSELLARKGCLVHLIDIAPGLLRAAQQRLERASLADQICGVHQASATDLGCLEAESVDACLMLGPFYHLRKPEERRHAVEEARRILKRGGVLFAAGVNRMAYLRDLFREKAENAVERREFHRRFLTDGRLDPDHAPPIGYAYLTTVSEFRSVFGEAFEELGLVGTESFTTAWQSKLCDLTPDAKNAWLDLVEETGQTIEGLGQSDHFLFIGKRR